MHLELQVANSSVNSCVGLRVFRTNRAPTVKRQVHVLVDEIWSEPKRRTTRQLSATNTIAHARSLLPSLFQRLHYMYFGEGQSIDS